MATKQIRKNRMNESGTYDVIHYETDADMVLMSDGTTAEVAINNKQNRLTFDEVPTSGSSKPVTSDGVYQAIKKVTPATIGAAKEGHDHSASNITSGMLPVERGGTGASTAEKARENLGITLQNIGAVQSRTLNTIEPNATILETICNYADNGIYSGQFQATDNVSDNPETNWAFAIEFVNVGGETISVRAHKLYEDVVYFRQINLANRTYMSEWAKFATTNYAVSKGGDTMTGNLIIAMDDGNATLASDSWCAYINAYMDGDWEHRRTLMLRNVNGSWGLDNMLAVAFIDEDGNWIEYDVLHTGNRGLVTKTFTSTVTTAWTASGSYYYQDISMPGMLATDNPIPGVAYGTDNDANVTYDECFAKVLHITTSANSVRVWATEPISTAFPIQLKVVR